MHPYAYVRLLLRVPDPSETPPPHIPNTPACTDLPTVERKEIVMRSQCDVAFYAKNTAGRVEPAQET